MMLHDARRVLIDEAHLIKGNVARKIIDAHMQEGASIVGVTATPLDIGDLYDHLVIAGTNRVLRDCGALVPAYHYGPDEPDLRYVGRVEVGKDLTEKQNVAAIMRQGIFGRVLDWWKRLNPKMFPT
jgi:superfamily II DNA or RNA helicase